MIESQSRYINALITPILSARNRGRNLSLRPRKDRIAAYNASVQKVLQNSSFADPNCNSWYKNEAGLITNNWSGTVIDYQKQMERLDWSDYVVEGTGKEVVLDEGEEVTYIGRVVEETRVSDLGVLAIGVLSAAAVGLGFWARNGRYLSGLRIR